mgnify:CR=1 FL=1
MPEIIEDLLPPGKAATNCPTPVRAAENQSKNEPAGEQNDQQNREQEAGDGVADDDDARGPDVERRAVVRPLSDAERESKSGMSSSVIQMPSDIDTGSFSLISCETR